MRVVEPVGTLQNAVSLRFGHEGHGLKRLRHADRTFMRMRRQVPYAFARCPSHQRMHRFDRTDRLQVAVSARVKIWCGAQRTDSRDARPEVLVITAETVNRRLRLLNSAFFCSQTISAPEPARLRR
jgi:hypothetical protein